MLLIALNSSAQKNIRDQKIGIPFFSMGYSFATTMGDLSQFTNYQHVLIPEIGYKTHSNFIFSFESRATFGSELLYTGIEDVVYSEVGHPIDGDGFLKEVQPSHRGYSLNVKFGKLFPVFGPNPNSGLSASIGLGFLQHKINYNYEGTNVPQLEPPYLAGWDQLTNGMCLSQHIGILQFSNRNTFNFRLGIDALQAFTKNRRSFNYASRSPQNESRMDGYIGIRFSFIIPAYGKNG